MALHVKQCYTCDDYQYIVQRGYSNCEPSGHIRCRWHWTVPSCFNTLSKHFLNQWPNLWSTYSKHSPRPRILRLCFNCLFGLNLFSQWFFVRFYSHRSRNSRLCFNCLFGLNLFSQWFFVRFYSHRSRNSRLCFNCLFNFNSLRKWFFVRFYSPRSRNSRLYLNYTIDLHSRRSWSNLCFNSRCGDLAVQPHFNDSRSWNCRLCVNNTSSLHSKRPRIFWIYLKSFKLLNTSWSQHVDLHSYHTVSLWNSGLYFITHCEFLIAWIKLCFY